MAEVELKVIPAHIAYAAEYEVRDYNDFFDEATGANKLADLEERMHKDNPDVRVPKMPNDYNYFVHAAGERVTSPMRIRYHDMVDKAGRDGKDYRFVQMPQITAATMLHRGPFERIGETYAALYRWISEQGYEIAGDGRSSAIDGPWNRQNRSDYLMEVQIPVKKLK